MIGGSQFVVTVFMRFSLVRSHRIYAVFPPNTRSIGLLRTVRSGRIYAAHQGATRKDRSLSLASRTGDRPRHAFPDRASNRKVGVGSRRERSTRLTIKYFSIAKKPSSPACSCRLTIAQMGKLATCAAKPGRIALSRTCSPIYSWGGAIVGDERKTVARLPRCLRTHGQDLTIGFIDRIARRINPWDGQVLGVAHQTTVCCSAAQELIRCRSRRSNCLHR